MNDDNDKTTGSDDKLASRSGTAPRPTRKWARVLANIDDTICRGLRPLALLDEGEGSPICTICTVPPKTGGMGPVEHVDEPNTGPRRASSFH